VKYFRVEKWRYSFVYAGQSRDDALPGSVEYGTVWRRERTGAYAPAQGVYCRAGLEELCEQMWGSTTE